MFTGLYRVHKDIYIHKGDFVMKKIFQTLIVSSTLMMSAMATFAASPIVGYWKSMDDRTGEPLSLIEIKQEKNGRYSGTIIHRYPNQGGHTLTTCAKCPEPFKDKPLVGLKILTGFTELKAAFTKCKSLKLKISARASDRAVWPASMRKGDAIPSLRCIKNIRKPHQKTAHRIV